MPAIATSALVSLAAVLLLSGAAKLLAPSTGRTILDTVPLPGALRAPWVQRALPWCEVLLAAALCVSAGPLLTVAAGLATVLFAAFAVVVHRGTRAPDPASCGCFGELSRAAVSRRTVVRNAAFTLTAALALVLTLTGFHGPALELPWWGAVAVGIPLVLVLLTLWSEGSRRAPDAAHDVADVPPLPPHLRAHDDAAASSEARQADGPAGGPGDRPGAEPDARAAGAPGGVEPGTEDATEDYERLPIPYATLTDAAGRTVTLRDLAASRARALFGVSSTCGWCAPVVERLAAAGGAIGPVAVHTVVTGEDERAPLPGDLPGGALVDGHAEMGTVFQHPGTPWAVVLGADGLLAGGPVSGSGAVLELLDELEERFAG